MPAFRDPVAAYTAVDNFQARFLCDRLIEAGIEAMVVEDASQDGTFPVKLSGIYKPQVWVERADRERAQPVIQAFERRTAELYTPPAQQTSSIEVVCEECGAKSTFPGTLRGSVQDCPHCHAFVDVGEDEEADAWTAEVEGAGPADDER